MIASILLGAGLMPKRSMIISSHSIIEKRNSGFGRVSNSLLCSSKVQDGMIISSGQLRASFFLALDDAAIDIVGKS